MDNSKEYIKMCRMAEELNYIPSGTDGNWYYYDVEDIIRCRNSYEGDFGDVWLPRQDQLQEMIFDRTALRMIAKFMNFCMSKSSVIDGRTYSMEQLWLAFVMKEKYNKIWNGEDWVNE